MNNSSGSEDKSMDNLWVEALNEQNAAGSTE
ncbi:flagellar motor switch protein FliN, partial [Escherichia coli]|nr:flagellar motor switch protein FliN [Escherichia coli]